MSFVSSAKALVQSTAKSLGIQAAIRDSAWRSRRLLILGYHGVSIHDEHIFDPALYIPPALLRARCETLRRGGYAVLPLDEAVSRLSAGTLPPRAVTLTFDDGGRDFRLRACPILAEYGFPSTVYLTTYYATHRFPVFNVFALYLLSKANGSVDLTGILPDHSSVPASTPAERSAAQRLILTHAAQAKWTNDEMAAAMRELARRVGADYDALAESGVLHIMNQQDISELHRFGASVQLHTHRHRTPNDQALFRNEIRDNREAIIQLGGAADALRHFCYPSGVYRPEFFAWLKADGIVSATTCENGLASRESNPLALPRFLDTCGVSPLQFEAWVTGASYLLPRRSPAHAD